jgi:neutral trehalase
MPSASAIVRYAKQRLMRAWHFVARFQRLIAYATYLLLWSKLFVERPKSSAIESALLSLKSIKHMPPELTATAGIEASEHWSEGFGAVNVALFRNLRGAGRLSETRHAHPAPRFRAVYLWDSAFIAQIWKWWDLDVAWDVLRAVIDSRQGDRLQHFTAEFAGSTFTQPPLIAWSLEKLCLVAEDEQSQRWIRHSYEPLRRYLDWLNSHRRLPNGLYAWAHPYESGVENAPRFSTRDERRLDDTTALAAPDLCSYVVLKCESLARLARRIDRGEEAAALDRQADVIRAKVNGELWDAREGLYFDRHFESRTLVRSRTIASLLPLWAGIPDQKQAEQLVGHITDPTSFNTTIPLPSVSIGDPAFEKDMWRGPVWLNTAFAVIEGLRRYGFYEVAADFAYRLCDGVYRTFDYTGHFHEFYDPERFDTTELHRKRGNRWKQFTLGPKPVTGFVGWSGLVNTLVIEVLFGLERAAEGLSLTPRFPPAANGSEWALLLPQFDLDIRLSVQPNGEFHGVWRFAGDTQSFVVSSGERLFIGTGNSQ